MKLIARGAEAEVFSDGKSIVKKRQPKGYRIKELDERLRKSRTKREAKILEKMKLIGAQVPKIRNIDENKATITMENVNGRKTRDILDESNCESIGSKMGESVALMHANNIIHGDLTTSNTIVSGSKLYLIDFGLGLFSEKAEDKAVDIHLLRQALKSSHNKIAEKCFKAVTAEYVKKYKNGPDILKRLEKVEARGRYKGKKN